MAPGDWTFLSNYGHVLVALARNPTARMRDIAQQVGITQRAVQQIVGELVTQGYVIKEKSGRRNHYHLAPGTHLRHDLERGVRVADFVAMVSGADETNGARASRAGRRVDVPMCPPRDQALRLVDHRLASMLLP